MTYRLYWDFKDTITNICEVKNYEKKNADH